METSLLFSGHYLGIHLLPTCEGSWVQEGGCSNKWEYISFFCKYFIIFSKLYLNECEGWLIEIWSRKHCKERPDYSHQMKTSRKSGEWGLWFIVQSLYPWGFIKYLLRMSVGKSVWGSGTWRGLWESCSVGRMLIRGVSLFCCLLLNSPWSMSSSKV